MVHQIKECNNWIRRNMVHQIKECNNWIRRNMVHQIKECIKLKNAITE